MSILGNRVVRTEDPHLLTGGGSYVANLDWKDALEVAFAVSPVAHGLIRAIEIDAALAMEGVEAVYTAADIDLPPLPSAAPNRPDTSRPLLASGRVRFVGEPIAMVIARTAAIAEDAANLVWADIEPLPALIDPEEAATSANHLFDGSNVLMERSAPGDPDLFSGAAAVVSERIVNQRVAPAPMEPRALGAEVTPDGRLVAYASTQSAHRVKAVIAKSLGLEPNAVLVRTQDVGGGFGAKASVYPEEILTAYAAWRMKRAVRWVENRSNSMLGLVHGRGQIQYVTAGADASGRLLGLTLHIVQDGGAYPFFGIQLPNLTILMASGAYRIPKIEGSFVSVATNTTPIAAYRGAGRPEAAAALERILDRLAAELQMDPAEIRRRNFIDPGEFPYTTASGARYDSGEYSGALEKVLEEGRYEQLRSEQERRRRAGSPLQLGIGLSSYVEITNGLTSGEYASIRIDRDGRATVFSGTSPHGQGHKTAWAMIAADLLGLPMEAITVITGDTDLVPRGVGTFGSRSAQAGGSAVREASEALLATARDLAASLLEADPQDMVPGANGLMVAGSPTTEIGWAEIASEAERAGVDLVATADFEPTGASFPFGSHLAVVEVDTETGKVKLVSYTAVDDAGPLINPMLAEGQIHGGIAQGAAQALMEEFVYASDGTPLTANLADYPAISAPELPEFNTYTQETPTPLNPLGVKGIGESGTTGAIPAVQNAVVDALSHLGIRHIDMPLTGERVWRAIAAAKNDG